MIHETRQLLRLRSLRVQRAREQAAKAQAEVEAALRAVEERKRAIEAARRDIDALQHAVVHRLAPQLPRWSQVATAHRARLFDRLQREEYGLVDDEHALEQAQEHAQRARAELTRALGREDAVRGMVDEARRALALVAEQKLERENDDQLRRTR